MARKGYVTRSFIFDGRRHYAYGKTEKEAEANRTLMKAELEAGKIEISRNTLVKDWITEWQESYKEQDVNSRWYSDIKGMCNNYINPAIGHMQISKVRPLHIKRIFNDVADKSGSYNAKLYDILKQIFRTASENELIVRDPMTGLKKPQGTAQKKRRAITDQERKLTLEVARTHRGGLFVLIMLYCGLRPQEVVPLQWHDIDIEHKQIHIYKALKSDGIVRNVPKSEAGLRDVPIPDCLLIRLKKERRGPFELVCANTRGERYTSSSFHDLWKNFKREMNIAAGCKLDQRTHQLITDVIAGDLTLYCYRHTYCTDLQAAGVPINVARELMGHEDISITSKIYTHKSDEALQNAAKLINAHTSVVRGVVQGGSETAKTANNS